MTADHDHTGAPAAARAGSAYKRHLAWAFGLIAVFFVVEAITGVLTNSLALLGDAGHMFTDVLGLGMALAAIHVADRTTGDRQRTFGLYRLEILAALANAMLLFGIALFILYEAVQRFSDPPEVAGIPLLVVALLGLAVNIVAWLLLRRGAGESINLEAAYLEVIADTLGSVAVVVAAIVLETTGFALIDPIFGVAIGAFVLPRTWRLGRRALRILLQAAPEDLDLDALAAELEQIDGVTDAHDLHVWTLTSGMEVASVHIRVDEHADTHGVLDRARDLLRDTGHVEHATVQVDPPDHRGCEEIRW